MPQHKQTIIIHKTSVDKTNCGNILHSKYPVLHQISVPKFEMSVALNELKEGPRLSAGLFALGVFRAATGVHVRVGVEKDVFGDN